MSRSVLGRLIALAVITVAGLYYILFDAVGIHLTDQPYTVHVVLPNAGGIYTDAYVTYRGVEVGKVSALHLEKDRVVVDLALSHGTRIPGDVGANVRELTAAAEQYMDLVPEEGGSGGAGGYLKAGDTIPESRATVPVTVGQLLDSLNTLVNSLSAGDLNTLSSALATGLQGAGQDLHSIIVDGNTLVTALDSAIPGTAKLINAGNTVLSTFNATSGEFAAFSANLNALSAQVRASNSDLTALLRNGAAAGQTLNTFLDRTADPTVTLINDLAASTNVAYARQSAVKALFEVLPLFSQDVAMVTTGGQIRFELTFNTASPVCPYTTTMLEPTTLVSAADLTGDCHTEAPNMLQRGADKAPPPG